MQSRAHAVVGAAVSLVLVALLWPSASLPLQVTLWTYGVALSVLVDLDHFLVARLLVGDWRHARRVLGNPAGVFGDQRWIFADLETVRRPRLLSHAVLGGGLVVGLWGLAPSLGAFTAVVLYAHVVADLLRDNDLV